MHDAKPFRSLEGRAAYLDWYDRQLQQIGVPIEERDLPTTAAGRTHVVIAGPEAGEPLFLVHGAGAGAAFLRDEIPQFVRAGHRVYAPDVPGHMGKSDPRKLPLKDDTIGRWLSEVMAGLGVNRSAFVGYSLGGLIVLKLAEHAPEKIARAVVLVPAGFSPPTVTRALPVAFARFMHGMTRSEKWRRAMLDPMFGPGTTPDPFVYEAGLLTIEHWIPDLRPFPILPAESLRRLDAPVLVLAGEQDPFFDWRATVAQAQRVLPRVTAEAVDGMGHTFDVEHLPIVRARIAAFFSEGREVGGGTRRAEAASR